MGPSTKARGHDFMFWSPCQPATLRRHAETPRRRPLSSRRPSPRSQRSRELPWLRRRVVGGECWSDGAEGAPAKTMTHTLIGKVKRRRPGTRQQSKKQMSVSELYLCTTELHPCLLSRMAKPQNASNFMHRTCLPNGKLQVQWRSER